MVNVTGMAQSTTIASKLIVTQTDSDGQCDWDGTINNYCFKTDSDSDFTYPGDEASDAKSDKFSEFGDEELLQMALESEAALLEKLMAYKF